jgi:uncharacterized membrane protein (DUF106 family)
MFNKVYGSVSVLFVLMIFLQAFLVRYISNPILLKVLHYGFWYVFGAFSVLFILRRIAKGTDSIS